MKTIIFILLLAFIPETYAQLNTSFEGWTNNGQYEDLNTWSTPNLFFSINGKISCSKQAPHWGDFSVGISPIPLPSLNDTLPGYIFQKNSASTRPKSISIYYRYPSMKTDSPSLLISYYKGALDTANMIGSCLLKFDGRKDWTKISGNIQWKTNEVPDSVSVLIINAANNTYDTLFVDDLEISEFSTGIEQPATARAELFVTSDRRIIFRNISANGHQMLVRDIHGKTVFKKRIEEGTSLESLEPGLYIIEVLTTEGPLTRKILLY
jgi:hypothetical protein